MTRQQKTSPIVYKESRINCVGREREKGGAEGDGVEKHQHEAVERLELS